MGAMFIGQQYLQNVLGYSTFEAGLSIVPAALFMILVAPRSAGLVEARGARFTLLTGYVFVFSGLPTMLLLWGRQPVPRRRARLRVRRDRRRVRGDAGVAFADRIGARRASRNGLGHRGSPT